jgi:hypothetical protein
VQGTGPDQRIRSAVASRWCLAYRPASSYPLEASGVVPSGGSSIPNVSESKYLPRSSSLQHLFNNIVAFGPPVATSTDIAPIPSDTSLQTQAHTQKTSLLLVLEAFAVHHLVVAAVGSRLELPLL